MKRSERMAGFLKMLPLAFLFLVLVSACKDDDPAPLAPPAINAAAEITNVKFKASWTAVTGAEKYLLDVSVNSDFSTYVTNFNKKELTATFIDVTGLAANTKYYFRVYAKKGTVLSAASATKDVTTAN